MSQYPMYPTQLSYLPAAPMYGYPANYPYMLPAAMYPGTQGQAQAQTQASMITQQQQSQIQSQIQSQASQETGADTSKEAGARQEMVTVSSSVGEESEDRSEYIEELTREKEALGETGNSHAKRLIDRGNNT